MENYQKAYKEEAAELLAELETSLLELEEDPNNSELIGRIFRALHTIKGSGAMFGFTDIAEFTHELETIFDLVRDGRMAISRQLLDLTLRSRDHIKIMLDNADSPELIDTASAHTLIAALRKLISTQESCEEACRANHVSSSTPSSHTEGGWTTYRIRFRPSLDIIKTGTNPILLLNELRELGKATVVAQTESIPALTDIDPELCYVFWDIILTTTRTIDAVRDVFIFVEDQSELRIEAIDKEDALAEQIDHKRLGEILIERGDISASELAEALQNQKRIGEILLDKQIVTQGAIHSALAEQKHIEEVRTEKRVDTSSSSIRVAAEKLDTLVSLVGELVTVQASLSQMASRNADPDLLLVAEQVERLTDELRDNTMSIRMLPIGTTFSRLRRLVRDLSKDLGKEVVLVTEGGATELDKTVIERLNDPLVHIIRNCIDHGIELPQERECRGKNRGGTVRLSAEHSGASVVIRIADDGKGLDRNAIREKAIEKGLITAEAEYPDEELFSYIFSPGFSTATTVTDVSGRGVGMDVVKKNVEALRGRIEVSSAQGTGTTVTLRLPLTLAIIEGLMVTIGEGNYVFPLSLVEGCVEVTQEEALRHQKRNMMTIRGTILPYLNLRSLFHVTSERPAIEQAVVAEANGERVCFGVDHVVGQYQTVIKSLGKTYQSVKGISGATILGDGSIALILDVQQLVQCHEKEIAAS